MQFVVVVTILRQLPGKSVLTAVCRQVHSDGNYPQTTALVNQSGLLYVAKFIVMVTILRQLPW